MAALASVASRNLRQRCEPKPSLSFRQVNDYLPEAKGRFWLTKAFKSGHEIGIRLGKGKGYGKGKIDGLAAVRLRAKTFPHSPSFRLKCW